jgi:alkylresorcinol/alkylpyrone synthase
VAQELGEKAIQGALERSGLAPTALGAFFFVSATGIASPSIDACLMNRMQLPCNLKRMPIFGVGCVAGAAGIARAADYVRAYPKQAAVLLSVELCSLTLQRDDLSVANLISAGLYGDGAAAVVVAGSECPAQGPTILGSHSFFYPGTEYVMGWDISEKGFRIVLSPDVPLMVKTYLAANVDALLADFGLTRRDIVPGSHTPAVQRSWMPWRQRWNSPTALWTPLGIAYAKSATSHRPRYCWCSKRSCKDSDPRQAPMA